MNIDTYTVITSAIAGGIGGGLYGFLKKNKLAPVVFIVATLSIGAVFRMDIVKRTIMAKFDSNYDVREKVLSKMAVLMEIPKVKEYMATNPTGAEARNYTQKLVHSGLKRLSYEQLVQWNNTRKLMVASSPAVCAGLWNGQMTDKDLLSAMGSLSEAELDAWVAISLKSAELEVSQAPFVPSTTDDLAAGVEYLGKSRNADEMKRLAIVMAQGAKASSSDSCFAMTFILSSEELPVGMREKFLRYLASL
ncbi:MAG TPA: hypothetical protein VNJ08_06200 [Bacteriovoracaceae bacterium]|nr:hypothetical protein [Bacteriovoracaceae bacterium]